MNANGVRAGSALLTALENHARRAPDTAALATVEPNGTPRTVATWRQLAGRARQLSTALAAQTSQGDIVVMHGGRAIDAVAWYLGALGAGVSVLPIHRTTVPAEAEAIARRARAVACTPGSPSLAGLVAIDVERAGTRAAGTPGAVVLVSSGTTGASKLAVRSSAALDADARNVVHVTGLGSADRVLLAVPACHSYGLDMIVASVLGGACLDILDPFDPQAAAAHLTREGTVFPGVPVMFEALARADVPRPAALRVAFSAGAPLPDRVLRAFESRWGRGIGQLYGATELGSVTFCDSASPDYTPGSVGRPMPGVSIRIMDPVDSGRVLLHGDIGHIAVRAPSMFSGYLDGDAPIADRHFLTGDLGRLDEHGRLFITGRLKLLIDVGGLKVNPQEIEAVLAAHPGVAECVVVPLPVSDTVTRLRAVYIPRDPAAPPADPHLREFLRTRLAPHQVPRIIEAAATLPRTPTGKILRQAVATC